MRQIVGGRAKDRTAASTSQMARFETEILTRDENLQALMDLPGVWVDRIQQGKSIPGRAGAYAPGPAQIRT